MSDENVVGLPNHLWLWSGVTIIASCVMIVMVREIDRHTVFSYQKANVSNNLYDISQQPDAGTNSKFAFPKLKSGGKVPDPQKMPVLIKL
jgi:hypothetical protein